MGLADAYIAAARLIRVQPRAPPTASIESGFAHQGVSPKCEPFLLNITAVSLALAPKLSWSNSRAHSNMDFIISADWPNILASLGVFTAAASVLLLVYVSFFYVDFPKIHGIPEIPGGELLAGHLYQLGADHATTAQTWSAQYGWPVFQLRMGYRRAVILNSFESARLWMIKNQSATIDRPWFYTFHGVVSKTSAATIGTSPWDERTKKQRRVVGSFTTGPSIQKMRHMLDMETCSVISGLYYDSESGSNEIMPHMYLKRLALNMMMMFCYGTRFTSVRDPLLLQILQDAQTVASFRSTNSNPQDFIPHLRYLGKRDRTATALEVRARRDQWLAKMLDNVRGGMNRLRPVDKKSVAEMLIENDHDGLTHHDVKTILSGLMSGGFETIFSTAIITVGMLSSPEGREIQREAYDNIMSVYDTPEQAFELCLVEEKCTYVTGLVKETLRFYPPLKLLPARQVYKEFEYQGATIPKGLLVYVNAQAANFGKTPLDGIFSANPLTDKSTYGPDADKFKPERWVDCRLRVPPPYHFAFGAGARQCTAVNLSNRVLYAMFVRLIVSFNIEQSKEMPCNTHYIDYKQNPAASNALPSVFKVKLTARDNDTLGQCLQQSQAGLAEFVTGTNAEVLVR
ncbi:Phenylacetate 2-hydroxylase [Talaromyces pinophilus]|nr:Phenylacetate 2-hydroxylase [Talaromyces pinophilus]